MAMAAAAALDQIIIMVIRLIRVTIEMMVQDTIIMIHIEAVITVMNKIAIMILKNQNGKYQN